jgi:hypothetical protein
MKRKTIVIILIILIIIPTTSETQTSKTQADKLSKGITQQPVSVDKSANIEVNKLEGLTSWVGEYPYKRKKHNPKNFLEEPLIKAQAIRLMGKKLYKRLILANDFLVSPVELKEGFFILDYTANWKIKKDYGDSVTIFINKTNGEIHLALYFIPLGEDRIENLRWLHSQSSKIPDKVINKAYWLNRNN